MKKFFKFLGIGVLGLVVIIVLVFAGIFVTNKVKLSQEAKKIVDYGDKIEVDGKKLNVEITGKGDKTIVLLPGFMTVSPVIDFKPLTEGLSKNNRVVVIEPLGYGLSDDTDKERSVENLTEEIHDVLTQLDIKNYVLMGHSIFGVYSLEYIKKYPNEVEAFVGIDSSLPQQGGADDNPVEAIKLLSQSGLLRIFAKQSPEMLNVPPVDEALKKQYEYLSFKNMDSNTTLNEGTSMPDNFKKTMDITYPKDLPVLYFLATESMESDDNWLTIHEDMLKDLDKSSLEVLDAGHYLHHTKSKEIVSKTNEFLK